MRLYSLLGLRGDGAKQVLSAIDEKTSTVTLPKNFADSVSKEEELPCRENFPAILGNCSTFSRITEKFSFPRAFLPYILGNLPCFWDSVARLLEHMKSLSTHF